MGRFSPGALRRLIAVPVVLLLALALVAPTSALATSTSTTNEGLSGYNKKTEEQGKTAPSKEKEEKAAPTETSKAPSKAPAGTAPATEAEKAATLPFTGFDLRWTVGMGLLLMGAGMSIVVVQRRHRAR
jgi:hypothetical protein